ncbi:MAG TPA: hypothetical protein VJB93_01545 [Patescibacteria group bacterium]|nr:hypothetical protein [Patescibacteria group bacterium]
MQEINLEQFHQLKQKTEQQYKEIHHVYCPALKDTIVFNSNGFHHLRYDSTRAERSKRTQMNKFRCLPDAITILKKSTTIQEYRRSLCTIGESDKNGLKKTNIVEWFACFAIVSFTNHTRIKVIIRRIGGNAGQYHFWSVMPFWTLGNNSKIIGPKDIEDA